MSRQQFPRLATRNNLIWSLTGKDGRCHGVAWRRYRRVMVCGSRSGALSAAGDGVSRLLWPAGALAITVLAFIMLGDAVRDALDPKLR